MIGGSGFVLGADVEREIARLAAIDKQPLNGGEIGLGRAVLFKDVAPAAGANLKIEGFV